MASAASFAAPGGAPRFRPVTLASLAVTALLACQADPPTEAGLPAPPGWDRELRVPRALDHDPAPGVVEVHLTAQVSQVEVLPGVLTELWTYDGHMPGPEIRGRVGDELVVHLTNQLPEPTTIHWHGLEVPADQDGTVLSHAPILPGERFTYRFRLPRAGTFWYHPHIASAAQVSRGLYGALVVEEAPGSIPEAHDLTLVLDDIQLEEDGRLAPVDEHGNLGDYFGREGQVLLVNGRPSATLYAHPGVPLRLRLLNAATARYFRVSLDGQALVRIGGDGGWLEHPLPVAEVMVVPGERAELFLVPRGGPGEVFQVWWEPYDRVECQDCRTRAPLMRLELVAGPAYEAPPLPERLTTIEPLDITDASLIRLAFTEASVDGRAVLGIDGVSWSHEDHGHHHTPRVTGRVGDTQLWRLENTTPMDHPFHLHGFHFQVLEQAGRRPPREWKDTVNLPRREVTWIAVRFDRPGDWMFHCHILEHAEIGMMGLLRVLP